MAYKSSQAKSMVSHRPSTPKASFNNTRYRFKPLSCSQLQHAKYSSNTSYTTMGWRRSQAQTSYPISIRCTFCASNKRLINH